MCCGGGERRWEDFKPGAVNQEAEGSGKSLGFILVIHPLFWMNATEKQLRLWRKGSLLAGNRPGDSGKVKGLHRDRKDHACNGRARRREMYSNMCD
jgi:hypothetical protein